MQFKHKTFIKINYLPIMQNKLLKYNYMHKNNLMIKYIQINYNNAN